MKCCSQCAGLERMFDVKVAADDLEAFRKKGAAKTTRVLVDALKAGGVADATLIDIGGGVGAIQHLLLKAGARSAVSVDVSQAYLNAAREEAERQGYAERITFRTGDFVNLAEEIEPADIVTLERVICCYPDAHALVGLSSARAARLYGVVFPRDHWWIRLGARLFNLIFQLQRNPFRIFIHSTHDVDTITASNGLRRRFHRNVGLWQVIVYER